MSKTSALQTNAADRDQVKRARGKEKDREAQFLGALKASLATGDGRYVLGELLERARIFETVYDHSGSTMYFNEGRRNFGLELLALLVEADEAGYELLERERRARRRDERIQNRAAHTAPADTQGDREP